MSVTPRPWMGTPRVELRDLVMRRFSTCGPLSSEETALIATMTHQREWHPAGTELASPSLPEQAPRILVSGWACKQRVLPDGRRQIFSYLVPGDMVGLCERTQPPLCTVSTLTRAELFRASRVNEAWIRRDPLYPRLTRVCDTARRQEEAHLLDHLVRLGRQTAYERVAHLLLELNERLSAVGLSEDNAFAMPLTQEMLADTLGLSIVHVNRTLQQLRREHTIEFQSGRMRLVRPAYMAAIADFEPLSRDVVEETDGDAQL